MVLKLEIWGDGVLFQAAECTADQFMTPKYDWEGKSGETTLYSCSLGCHEDEGGRCRLTDVFPNWD
jgi:hypothetical protein